MTVPRRAAAPGLIAAALIAALAATVAAEDARLSLRVAGRSVPVERWEGAHVARVAIAGPTAFEVTSPFAMRAAELLPSRLGLAGTIRGRGVRFTLAEPRDLVVRVPGHEPLVILADSVHGEPPAGRSVAEFGADRSGRRPATAALQAAIDAVAGTGGVLHVPAGTYRTGMLVIRGAMTLWLAPGARLVGSTDPGDYPTDARAVEPDLRRPLDGRARDGARLSRSQMVLIDGASDVTLAGHGVIDGAGDALRAAGKPAALLRIRDAHRVRVEGLVLRDAATWNSHILRSEDVTFHRVRVFGDRAAPNTDGIDPDGSRRVTIEHCWIDTGDDAIAVKATGPGGRTTVVGDITVRNSVLRTRKSAMKVGTESRCDVMRDITFAGNDVLEADRAMSLYCRDGARFERIEFSGNRVEAWTAGGTAQILDGEIRRRDGRMGTIEGVVIRDTWFGEHAPVASSLRGLDRAHAISGVRFENVTIGARPCRSAGDVPLRVNAFVAPVRFTHSVPLGGPEPGSSWMDASPRGPSRDAAPLPR